MSNITIACICLAVFSVCIVIGGIILIILEAKEKEAGDDERRSHKLHEVERDK